MQKGRCLEGYFFSAKKKFPFHTKNDPCENPVPLVKCVSACFGVNECLECLPTMTLEVTDADIISPLQYFFKIS